MGSQFAIPGAAAALPLGCGARTAPSAAVSDGPADRLSADRPVEAYGAAYHVRWEGVPARAAGSDVTLTGGVAGTVQAKTTDELPTANAQPTSRKPQAARRKPAEPR